MADAAEPPRQLSLFPEDNEAYETIEQLVELLLEPAGRAQRAKAVALLRQRAALGRLALQAA